MKMKRKRRKVPIHDCPKGWMILRLKGAASAIRAYQIWTDNADEKDQCDDVLGKMHVLIRKARS